MKILGSGNISRNADRARELVVDALDGRSAKEWFLIVELALVVLAVALYTVSDPTAETITGGRPPMSVTGLLLGAWAILLGIFGLLGVAGYEFFKRV
jgi:hypothetical protein